MEWTAIAGATAVLGLVGSVFYYAVMKPLTDNIDALRRAIEQLNENVSRIEEKRQDMDKRLVAVEESVKSAHHRINGMKGGM